MIQDMARRTCFREQYYTGTRGITLGRVDSRPRPKKTICNFLSVFLRYLEIAQFVLDRAVCGTSYWVGAGRGCSGVAQKIDMRKIRWQQGLVHDEDFLIFHGLGTFDEAKLTLQGPGVRADAQ